MEICRVFSQVSVKNSLCNSLLTHLNPNKEKMDILLKKLSWENFFFLNTENPHTVLHGRFLINQCFGPLNEPGFVKRAYYSFCCN